MDTNGKTLAKKKILIDTTFLFDQFASRGIGRYGKELVVRLIYFALEEEKVELSLIGFLSFKENLIHFGLQESEINEMEKKIKFFSLGTPKPSGILNIYRWYKSYLPVLKEYNPDIFFSPNFERGLPSHPVLNLFKNFKTKSIVTIYDVIPIAINRYTSKTFLHNLVKKFFYKFMFLGAEKADTVLTISNFSKDDIVKYTKVEKNKIKVIYLGVSESFKQNSMELEPDKQHEILEVYGLKNEKYFFYDSGLEPNKGINELLKIVKKLKNSLVTGVPLAFVIVGKSLAKGRGSEIKAKDALGENFIEKAKVLGVLDNIITTDKISEQILRVLLFNASAYLYLSKYEGFGFGPVQAMKAGIPAIGYNGSCIPEITDGGALLINSTDTENSCRQIVSLLTNKELLDKFVQRGYIVAERYNWDVTAKESWIELKRLL